MRGALSPRRRGGSNSGGHRDRPALGEAGAARGDCPSAAHGATLRCGREREGPAGLRGLSEHPKQRAWDGALYSDATAGSSVAGGGRGEGFFGCEPFPLCGYRAFGVGGATGRPPGRVWCARLGVSSGSHGTNARRVRPGGGGDRQDAPGRGVLGLGQSPRGGRPRRRGYRGSRAYLSGR